MAINKQEIEKYFSVGDIVATGGGRTQFEIMELSQKIKIRPTEGEKKTPSSFTYEKLVVVIENIEEIDPKNIQTSVGKVLEQNNLVDTTNESYLYGMAKEYLNRKNSNLCSSSHIQTEFERAVEKAKQSSSDERQERLKNSSKKPEKITTTSISFKRNSDVVAEILERANGICEECKNPAPFIRKSDNTPYLEVHHKIRLADNGDDTVENAIALCPNCHRKSHFG
ncbi:MAG: HNH endonuclease signature motif containing protein [Methylococcales bacterium]|nr:HNH endonuclease signature motif containing protein [Methylococcales bacterium]MDD5753781.1 HNH endonuclease signature motif containing protein [Methylococcales bacterium]